MTGSGKPKIKTVNIFLGFFFVVNFCLGTGFLGVPYSFFYSGYLAAIPTLLLICIISWINANYLLEVMARAQVRSLASSSYPRPQAERKPAIQAPLGLRSIVHYVVP